MVVFPGRRGITPVFGYTAPHPSGRGTSTLRIKTLPSTHYVSNADAETPLSTLALVACSRCRVEEFFEDCKSYLGMAQYETRSWVGWHHHMSLVGLAPLFVTLARKRLQKKWRC